MNSFRDFIEAIPECYDLFVEPSSFKSAGTIDGYYSFTIMDNFFS